MGCNLVMILNSCDGSSIKSLKNKTTANISEFTVSDNYGSIWHENFVVVFSLKGT